MMSLQSRLQRISDALVAIYNESDIPVYHYWRFGTEPKYIIWQENGEGSLEANNHKAEQAIYGSVDYYTLDEFDTIFDDIQEALNSVEGLYWEYDGTDYEDETNYIHHNWTWRLI